MCGNRGPDRHRVEDHAGARHGGQIEGDEEPELTIELGFVLSDMLYAPLRRRIANEELSAARVDAAGAVLDHAYESEV